MKDYLIRAIDRKGMIRIFATSTTEIVEKARQSHKTSPTATAALGRTLTAGVMMGVMMKNKNDSLTLKISGDGPGGNILVVAKNNGKIKGYIDNPTVDIPSREDGKLDVAGIVGKNGTITTTMDLGLKEPYVGQTNLVSGEIAEDLANLYMVSEQQPSAVNLGVLVDKDISVKAAGGYILQLLPGIADEDIDKIEENINSMDPISSLIDKGLSPEDIIKKLLKGFEIKILDKIQLEYICDCSRERLENVIRSLGEEEIKSIIEEDGEAEIVCHFCNTKYQFNKEELYKLLIDN